MDCGIVASKTVLLFLSLMFWAAGAALAYVGVYVISSYKSFEDFRVDQYTFIPAVIIIGVAVVMFIIGIIGCCATVRESKVGLGFFLLIIFLIFAAEVTAIVFGLIYKGKINKGLDNMGEVFEKYDGKNSESRAVDYLQTQLQCCGVLNYTDWSKLPWFTSHNTVPVSCCKNQTSCNQLSIHPEELNTNGCKTKLEQLLLNVLTFAVLVILGFAIIKFIGMCSVFVIYCQSSRNDYEPLYS